MEKILKRLLEKFGTRMGDAEYVGPGVPDEGDIVGGRYGKKKRKLKSRKSLTK